MQRELVNTMTIAEAHQVGAVRAEAPDFKHDFCWNKLRAKLTKHGAKTTKELRSPMDKRFVQNWDTGVVQ